MSFMLCEIGYIQLITLYQRYTLIIDPFILYCLRIRNWKLGFFSTRLITRLSGILLNECGIISFIKMFCILVYLILFVCSFGGIKFIVLPVMIYR
jgi:hypothetical protein